MAIDDPEPAAALDRRRLAWRLARLAAVLVVVVLVIAKVPGLRGLRSRFAHADGGWIVVAASLEIASVAAFVVAFHSALEGRLGWRSSASIATTAQGVNVLVPAGGTGGLAVAAVIMTRVGIPAAFTASRMIALFLVTAGATNVLMVIVAGFGVATGVLPGHASLGASLVPAVLATLLLVAIAYLPRRLPNGLRAGQAGWRAVAQRAVSSLGDGIRSGGQLLRAHDPLLVFGSLGFVLLDLGALAAGFRALGSAGLPLGTMMLAYTLGQVGSVISLPGTTEGGLIGVFVLYGSPLALATSAVLLYRAAQTLVPLALGGIGVAQLRGVFRASGPAESRGPSPVIQEAQR